MSAEFSLLQHLGVSVDKCEPAAAARSSSVQRAPRNNAFRVWAPTQHPPSNPRVPADQVRGVLSTRRKGAQKSYADPTGEVLLRNEHGKEVQYVVYNSKVPSIYGVNKQLAERKWAEKAREADNNAAALRDCGLGLGQDAAQQERARKQILRELRVCALEQANRRKEEEHRDRERRIAQEKAQLRYHDAQAARREEEERARKAHQERMLRDAAAEAAAAREHATAAAAAEDMEGGYAAWNGADEDERRCRATQRRTREFAAENWQQAERQRAERKARAAEERERARAERAEVEQQMRADQLREAAKQRQAVEALRRAQEAERENRLAASAAAAAGGRVAAAPVGSLFDFAEQRESEEAQRAQQRLREDMAINARLAEAKRTQAREERERERHYAAEAANASFAELQREIAQSRLRRLQEQTELKAAAEAAAAQARERRQQEVLTSRSQQDDPLLFWGLEDSLRVAEAKAAAQRRYHEEVRRQAERQREARAREETAEKARERALVEYDNAMAKEAALRERREADEKVAQLRRTLEVQMAAKKQQQEREHLRTPQSDLLCIPAPVVTPLYRCPVTRELLPASAYDFGVQKSR